jgi:methylglutaconyl-CoA hydratase
MVTAESFSAAQAHSHGLVHVLCSAAQLDRQVAELVTKLVANGPLASRACKKLVRDVSGAPMDEALRADTARRIADIRASDEGREGLQSFLQKRPPSWLAAPTAT